MRQSIYLILCVIIGFAFYQIFSYLGIPYWASVASIPVLVYAMIFATNLYSFRISLDFEKIPAKGYGMRVIDLKQNERRLYGLGFKKFDEFYWRIAAEAVVYVYVNEERTVVICDYHLGSFKFCDLITNFSNGFSLTTSSAANSRNIPRSNKKMLQIFDGAVYSELLRNHLQSVEFLKQKGNQVKIWRTENFRLEFIKAFLRERKNTITLLSPFKFLYRIATNHKAKYMMPIQQQFAEAALSPEKTRLLPQQRNFRRS